MVGGKADTMFNVYIGEALQSHADHNDVASPFIINFPRDLAAPFECIPALIICRFSFPVGLALPPFYLPLSSITRGDRKIFIFVDLRAFSTLSETKMLRDASCLDVTINWKILNYMMIFDKTSFLWNNFKNSRKGKENVVKKFLFFWWKWFLLLRI